MNKSAVIRTCGFTALSALLLTWSCTKQEEGAGVLVPANVPLSLSFSVSGNLAPSTKMTGSVTQIEEADFRGMEKIEIIPFKLTSGTSVSASDTRWSKNIGLLQKGLPAHSFADDADGGKFSGLVRNSNSHLYDLVLIYSQTNAALAYGKALDEAIEVTGEDSLAYKRRNGVLHSSDLKSVSTPSDIVFSLEPFLNDRNENYKKETLFNTWKTNLLAYLNGIAGKSVTNNQVSPAVTYQFNRLDQHAFPADFVSAFDRFVACGAVTPASEEELDGRLTGLYRSLYNYSADQSLSESYKSGSYYYVYQLANAILSAINNSTYVDIQGSGVSATVNLKEQAPAAFGLPAGSSAIQFREGLRAFSDQLDNLDENIGVFISDERAYTYPPALFYESNGLLRTTDSENAASWYDKDTGAWDKILEHYENEKVTSTSKSAALVQPLDYAVAQLALRLNKCSAWVQDSKGIDVAMDNTDFPLTGILIAGQKNVDYSFSPISSQPQYIVYDADVSGAYMSSYSDISETVPLLLLASEDSAPVNFALEFKNESETSFYGINGCEIAPGMHFYLLGTLNMEEGTVDAGKSFTSIFTKDHITELQISFSDLKKAHTVLPDLRELQLSIGVQAQINWDNLPPITVEIQ